MKTNRKTETELFLKEIHNLETIAKLAYGTNHRDKLCQKKYYVLNVHTGLFDLKTYLCGTFNCEYCNLRYRYAVKKTISDLLKSVDLFYEIRERREKIPERNCHNYVRFLNEVGTKYLLIVDENARRRQELTLTRVQSTCLDEFFVKSSVSSGRTGSLLNAILPPKKYYKYSSGVFFLVFYAKYYEDVKKCVHETYFLTQDLIGKKEGITRISHAVKTRQQMFEDLLFLEQIPFATIRRKHYITREVNWIR